MNYKAEPLLPGFKPQKTGLKEFERLVEQQPNEIVAFFRANLETAQRVLGQSYDKRYSPSTFIEEAEGSYKVGWYDHGRKNVRKFQEFSEAVTDYLLFSFGKGRLQIQTIQPGDVEETC
jgi:hypothetical protein